MTFINEIISSKANIMNDVKLHQVPMQLKKELFGQRW